MTPFAPISTNPKSTLTTEHLKKYTEEILQPKIKIKRLQHTPITCRSGGFIAFIEFEAYGDLFQFRDALNTLLTKKLGHLSIYQSTNIVLDLNYNQSYLLLTQAGLIYLEEIFNAANQIKTIPTPPASLTDPKIS